MKNVYTAQAIQKKTDYHINKYDEACNKRNEFHRIYKFKPLYIIADVLNNHSFGIIRTRKRKETYYLPFQFKKVKIIFIDYNE